MSTKFCIAQALLLALVFLPSIASAVDPLVGDVASNSRTSEHVPLLYYTFSLDDGDDFNDREERAAGSDTLSAHSISPAATRRYALFKSRETPTGSKSTTPTTGRGYRHEHCLFAARHMAANFPIIHFAQ
jgi:hypothetical protein